MAGGILIVNDQGVVVAAKVGGNAVDLADVDAPAADGSTHYFQLAAAHPFQPQQGGVGVGTAQHHGADGIIQPGLLRQGKAVRDAFIVWQHAQQPGHQRTVGTVAAACGGKAAMQQDLGGFWGFAQQVARCKPNAHRASRVAAGRACHHGAQHIK